MEISGFTPIFIILVVLIVTTLAALVKTARRDKMIGVSMGFGFVEMPNKSEAQAAIRGLNGKELSVGRTGLEPVTP